MQRPSSVMIATDDLASQRVPRLDLSEAGAQLEHIASYAVK